MITDEYYLTRLVHSVTLIHGVIYTIGRQPIIELTVFPELNRVSRIKSGCPELNRFL
jgi:hypothetical protein